MNFELVKDLGRTEVSRAEWVILMYLIGFADEDGRAWPSVHRMIDEVPYKDRHVKDTISKLKDKGVLKDAGWSDVGTKIREIDLSPLPDRGPYTGEVNKDPAKLGETEPEEVSVTSKPEPTASDNGAEPEDEPPWEINQDRMQERNFERGIKWFVKSRGPHNFGCECNACKDARQAWKASEEGQAYMEEKRRWEDLEQKATF